MSYQLSKPSQVKMFLIRQFYVKGTNGKMVNGLNDTDYQTFKEFTRLTEMVEILDELRIYRGIGKNPEPFLDLDTAYDLVKRMNNQLTSIQLHTTNLDTVFKDIDNPDEYNIYSVASREELIDNMKQFESQKKLHKRGKHTTRKANKAAKAKLNNRMREQEAVNRLSRIKKQLNEPKKFVALDFEAFERNQKKVTEIGFSIFENNKFTHHHYIIKENIKCLNGKFVPNNKFNFAFGESEVLALEEAFSRLGDVLVDTDYLIGHGVSNELKWLRHNDVKLHNKIKLIDTGKLGGGIMQVGKRASLTRVLDFLGVDHNFLHNAGNDSFYTMKALWHMVVRVPA